MTPQQWSWEQLTETAEHFTSDGKYGFQFRPTFAHLSSLMSRQGGELYQTNGGSITGRIAVSALAGVENTQPIEDMLRALLNPKTQLVLARAGAGLPVRSDLLNPSALQEIDIPLEVSEIFLTEARDFQNANMPENLEHKLTVENLFLELWLGLDNIDSICQRFKEC
ncbi:MAG: hypothetical protein KAJ46_05480 [Sedimentisphaerales bacterium]|nr:hypothetical protein [Sedimentisphaerales bacterium]